MCVTNLLDDLNIFYRDTFHLNIFSSYFIIFKFTCEKSKEKILFWIESLNSKMVNMLLIFTANLGIVNSIYIMIRAMLNISNGFPFEKVI